MPRAILVGFDPVAADRSPVDFGVAAARFTGAPLIVGSVVEEASGTADEDLSSDATGPLDDIRRVLADEGVAAEVRLLGGSSAPGGLHRAAEELDAGLLVVGSTGRGKLGQVLPGSTAERLMHGAPCPVAVVPRSWQPGGGVHRIGVAWGDSPEGEQALVSALSLAQRAGATVRILRASRPLDFGRAAGGRPGAEVTSFDAAGVEAGQLHRELLADVARRAPGVRAEVDVSAQDPADFLVAASEHLDLLVCGSRGYGPAAAVLLGGVSRRVVAAAHCPVIVLARGVESGLHRLVDDAAGAPAST